ncbi:Imm42 family immunity protein [Methylophilus sp. 5]|uniref:Imm42 family immunity protein n=1 Tax=Methylophilus sp. 5 TaxID=1112274 RepID=UPI000490A45F|nr:Imm42 family immunity protein [Methylophilus sp. 5]
MFGTWEFGITFEVLERQDDSHFVFGFFNIVIDDELLIHRGSNWTLDCMIAYLKRTIEDIEAQGLVETNLGKDNAYIQACATRNYYSYIEMELIHALNEFPEDKELSGQIDDYDKKVTNIPFGIEIKSYGELSNYGWRFFLFGAGEEERLIYSKDAGKTVFEKILPRDTVEKVLRSLPDPKSLNV